MYYVFILLLFMYNFAQGIEYFTANLETISIKSWTFNEAFKQWYKKNKSSELNCKTN